MLCGERPSDKFIDQDFPNCFESKGSSNILGAAFTLIQIANGLMSLSQVLLVLFIGSCLFASCQ